MYSIQPLELPFPVVLIQKEIRGAVFDTRDDNRIEFGGVDDFARNPTPHREARHVPH